MNYYKSVSVDDIFLGEEQESWIGSAWVGMEDKECGHNF